MEIAMRSPIVLGFIKNLSVLDVNRTLASLKLALVHVYGAISHGGKILFVQSRTMGPEVVSRFVTKTSQHFASKPLGGILTN